MSEVRYSIWNPTGNITALVETEVSVERQPMVAARLMELHSAVEQVGFVSVDASRLRMAGGEFCGNASICAAALLMEREDSNERPNHMREIVLEVSGVQGRVEVRLAGKEGQYQAQIHMPWAQEFRVCEVTYGGLVECLPVVMMEGISHIVIAPESEFFGLREVHTEAESAIRSWCDVLGVDGLGLMFAEPGKDCTRLAPLVYIPGSGTVYWEHSCASGSSAVTMWMSHATDKPVNLVLRQPGGELQVRCDALRKQCWLSGTACLMGEYIL